MFSSWYRRTKSGQNRKPRLRGRRRTRQGAVRCWLGLEGLEGRVVPAFLTPVTYAAGTNPAAIAVGDFNGDGRDDMAVVNSAVSGTVGVLLSNADGSFQPRTDYAAGANTMTSSPVSTT